MLVDILKSDRSSSLNTINALSIFNATEVIWGNFTFVRASVLQILKVVIIIYQLLFLSRKVVHKSTQF